MDDALKGLHNIFWGTAKWQKKDVLLVDSDIFHDSL